MNLHEYYTYLQQLAKQTLSALQEMHKQRPVKTATAGKRKLKKKTFTSKPKP